MGRFLRSLRNLGHRRLLTDGLGGRASRTLQRESSDTEVARIDILLRRMSPKQLCWLRGLPASNNLTDAPLRRGVAPSAKSAG